LLSVAKDEYLNYCSKTTHYALLNCFIVFLPCYSFKIVAAKPLVVDLMAFLKEGAAELAAPLAAIFNKSLANGVLPVDWVSANITPVFKNR